MHDSSDVPHMLVPDPEGICRMLWNSAEDPSLFHHTLRNDSVWGVINSFDYFQVLEIPS